MSVRPFRATWFEMPNRITKNFCQEDLEKDSSSRRNDKVPPFRGNMLYQVLLIWIEINLLSLSMVSTL